MEEEELRVAVAAGVVGEKARRRVVVLLLSEENGREINEAAVEANLKENGRNVDGWMIKDVEGEEETMVMRQPHPHTVQFRIGRAHV